MNRDLEPQKTESELTLDKIDQRDKVVRAIELITLGLLVIFSVFSSISLQSIISSNQSSAVQARNANLARQDAMQGYIKCIILLHYDNPTLNENSTRADVVKALDKCAKANS